MCGFLGCHNLIDHIDIIDVLVDKDCRRNNIASSLITHLFNFVITYNMSRFDETKKTTIANIILEVRESNSAAIKLYEKFNFKNIDIRKNYYSNPNENAIIMEYVI